MSIYAHKGQILPLVNQMIPISKDTTFHASYDYGLHGFNQGKRVDPIGHERVLDFDGNSGYISITGVAEVLHGKTEATVEMWVRKKAVQYGFMQLSGFSSTNGNLYPHTTNNTVYLDTFRTNRLGPITMHSPTTEWHHFAVTTEPGANGWKLFQNGEIVYEYEGQATVSTNYYGFEIGRNSGNRYANALFAEVRVWDYARSPEQIKEWMHKKASGGEAGLISCHRMDEREGPVLYDASSNGFDGIWSGNIQSQTGDLVVSRQRGKFKEAAYVEKATTNLVPEGIRTCALPFSSQHGTATYRQETGIDGRANVTRITVSGSTGNNPYAYFGITDALTAVAGDVVTISYEYKIIKGTSEPSVGIVYADGFKVPDATSYGTFTPVIIEELENGWKRSTRSVTIEMAGNSYFRWNYFSEEMEAEAMFDNFQIERGPIASSFVDGSRANAMLEYPIEVMNYEQGTLSFWMKHPAQMPYFNGNENDAYVSTAPAYGSTSSLVMAKAGAYDSRILGIHWGGVNGSYLHCAELLHEAPSFDPSDWNMITISWHKDVGYKYYINGVLMQDKRLDTGDVLVPFAQDRLVFRRILIDELRIEAKQVTDEEVAAWAASGLHYNYLDYSHYVD